MPFHRALLGGQLGNHAGATLLASASLLTLLGSPVAAQEGAALVGVVLSDATGEPLPGATVSLVRLDREVHTDRNGQFSIERVAPGVIRARFEAPGYVSVVEDFEMSAGAFLQVGLSPVAAVLDEILVMTGRKTTREGVRGLPLGDDAEGGRSILDLLESQVPGVIVRRGGGNLGGGAYVFIRGAGSLQGDNAPDVYLDGTRLDGRNTGARSLHVLDLISAEEVARIRVYKGASGGAGFALGAANGAIVIETNR